MYEAFYGFSEDPFRISPDCRFSYPHRSYLKAKNYLEYGLLRAEGIVVVSGEPGTGKSTVVNDLLSEYDPNELVVAKLLTTRIDSYDLLRMLAYSFGLDALSMDKATVLTRLDDYLKQRFESGQRALLIVDEAQNLSVDALEELRLLSNLQQYEQPLLQIFLIGQPKLQELIRSPSLEQLRQRLVAACHFEALDSEETQRYIEHRLSVVGWQQDPRFTEEAFKLIHQFSGGIPRRVNLICNRLLLHGHVESLHELGTSDVQQVIEELPPEMTFDEDSNEHTRLIADAASLQTNHELPEGACGPTKAGVHSEDAIRVDRRDTTDSKITDTMTSLDGGRPPMTLQSNTLQDGQASTSNTPNNLQPRSQSDTDPLLSLTTTRPLPSSKKSEEEPATAPVSPNFPRGKPRNRSFPPEGARPQARIKVKQRWKKPRSWMRPLAAGIVFVAAFGISYGYLRFNPGKYVYSPGASFQSEDPVADLKDPSGGKGKNNSDPETESDTYVYAQKETSSDLLNLTLSSLLPGPENAQEMGNSESISNGPPSSLRILDAENALRSIQDEQRQNHVLEEQSTQIIEEVIGKDQEIGSTLPSDPPRRQFEGTSTDQHEKTTQNIKNPYSMDAGVASQKGQLVINQDLENALRHYTPRVQRLSSGSLKITLNSDHAFQTQSARLRGYASNMLDKLAFVMRNYDGFRIQIVVQKADGSKADARAEALSEQRAKMIASHLIGRGIATRRIQPGGDIGLPLTTANTSKKPSSDHVTDDIGIYLKPEV